MISKIVLDINPTAENVRNSEGDFLRLGDGKILFAYSAFHRSMRDEGEADIAVIESADEGETWSEPRTLFTPADFEDCQNLMCPSLIRLRDGSIGLFFLIRGKKPGEARTFMFVSKDEGKTFGDMRRCIRVGGYYVTENQRVTRTSSGRLIFPGNFFRGYQEAERLNCYSLCAYFYSDDDGKSWHESPHYSVMPLSDSDTGLQETGIIELTPGDLLAYSRTDYGFQYGCHSYDDGLSWTDARPMRYFSSPVSPMKIIRLMDGRLCAVWNPIPNYTGRGTDRWQLSRNPMAITFSSDNGKTWGKPENFESDPERGYSYPAIFEGNGYLLVSYCAGNVHTDGGHLNRLRIRKFDLKLE